MKNWHIYFIAIIGTTACSENIQIQNNSKIMYPETRKVDVSDVYFNTKIADPYRWLENDTSKETENWVVAQNQVTNNYLQKISYLPEIKKRYEELFNYEKVSAPKKVGNYYFFYKNSGLQNQAVIYYQKGLKGEPQVFIDPNTLSDDGTVSVNLLEGSPNQQLVAYTVSEAGSDWQKIKVRNIETNTDLTDELKWVKFSGASWYNDGFFYSRYPEPQKGQEFSAANKYHSIYYHKIGDNQENDKLIYQNKDVPLLYHYGDVTEDFKYFILYVAQGTEGYECYYKDLTKGLDAPFTSLFTGFKNKSSVVYHENGKFYVQTNIDAPNYKLVEIDLKNSEPKHWKEIIPTSNRLLQSVTTCGGKFFADYLESASSKVYQYSFSGKLEREINLPGVGSAGGFYGKITDSLTFYTYTSFNYPPTIFKYNILNGTSEVFFKPTLKFNPDDYVSTQVFYPSKDGTQIPMFLVHKKDIVLDGSNPTLLYGYGGFNVSLTPSFSVSNILLLENGGVYALSNLRGGGEFGEDWHKAGMLLKKQNVFNDFIAAAEYLIENKYTSSAKLAIKGGSNGGLLVGACMNQRPELFKVAIPQVGVMDMLRYHKFTVGWGWIPEYGCADSSEADFKNLLSYSPLHNLKPANYPATLITTADHDDRVVPAHSFKFAAQLQAVQQSNNPVLIRIETKAGHGAGKPTSKIIEEQAELWAFMFYNVGITELTSKQNTN